MVHEHENELAESIGFDSLDSDNLNSSLCARFIESLPITGASISVFDEAGRQSTICASDPTASRLEELQFDLGEGPHWIALQTARPVLVSNLAAQQTGEWPIFSSSALALGVGAVFSFPMSMGAVTVGVVDLYRVNSGMLSQLAIETATTLAAGVAARSVRLALRTAKEGSTGESRRAPAMRREVHQATGMILAQLDIPATEAFFRLRAHAFATGRTVQDVAHDVVSRILDFRELTD